MIKINKGLDLPILGIVDPTKELTVKPTSVALLGADYVGLRPTMLVSEGEKVLKGQPLFEDKQNPGVLFTSPAAGVVKSINRGAQRVFQSIVIEVQGEEEVSFKAYSDNELATISREQRVQQLIASGLWTSFRTRPFSKIPSPSAQPSSIFVNVMDTNPLAVDPQLLLTKQSAAFLAGLQVLSGLAPKVFVCEAKGANTPRLSADNIRYESFSGVHPAGLPGTHIHFLDPVSANKSVWTIHHQDVIAIGQLFTTGRLACDRYIALGGPLVKQPKVIKTIVGACLSEVTANELLAGENRIISGSVLAGTIATGVTGYLGRYHLQVSVLEEGRRRDFMGWMSPGINRFSVMNIYLSKWMSKKRFAFTTNTNGSPRAIVPIGAYETVMPLDILATHLLKALVVGDMDSAIKLGALELDEEDLALCTYVCPGKYEYGPILRDNLTRIEKEG